EDTRSVVASPFWMCNTKGAMAHGGRVKLARYSLGAPVVLMYLCGPKTVTWAPAEPLGPIASYTPVAGAPASIVGDSVLDKNALPIPPRKLAICNGMPAPCPLTVDDTVEAEELR